MTTDFRALCTALLDEISHESPTTCLARAALANPKPKVPAECEVAELVAWLLKGGEDAAANGWDHQARQFGRAAELLQRLKPEPPTECEMTELVAWLRRSTGCADESPKDLRAADLLEFQHPQPPTDQELLHEWELVPGARAYEDDVIDFARAVLARWGNS